jgi:isoamylase
MERLDAVKQVVGEKNENSSGVTLAEEIRGNSASLQRIYKQWEPTDKIGGYLVRPGFFDLCGAHPVPGGVSFTIISKGASSIELCLFHRKEKKPFAVLKFPDGFRIGDTWSMIVFDLDIEEFEYCYRADGPWDPEKGLLFNKKNNLLDPYARAVTGQTSWGMKNSQPGDYHARVVRNNYDWKESHFPKISMEDSVIYEMHVRGFTKSRTSGVKYPGTFAGIIEKIPYLKELGITAVELMPIFEFDETLNSRTNADGNKLLEYWGYNTVCFFAPNTSYTASHEYNYEGTELRNMVRLLHENGIEVILDVVFNHTAEGNEKGPFISFKGLDNNIYYMLSPDGKYYNFSGCGNTLNCNHPNVRHFILECLRYWVMEYRVDGFRFDLASILGRNEDSSPMHNPPILEELAYDTVLSNVKLIAEAWDAGGLYQVGNFPAFHRWAEWNGSYRDCLRDYLKGNYWNAKETADRITGSLDLYQGVYEGYTSSVNFLTCHDGFTLYDLYAYNEKHNEANGWNNADGANDNRSWNCGTEGRTDDPVINDLRFKMMRNAIAVLMCSRGTPMILAGDEFANSQSGNNNSYCQDNEISWIDWSLLEKNRAFHDFYASMIHFRKQHPVIGHNTLPAACGLPQIMCSGPDMYAPYVDENTSTLSILFSGRRFEKDKDDAVILVVNSYWEGRELHLPELPDKCSWQLVVNTDDHAGTWYYDEPIDFAFRSSAWISPRSVLVFSLKIKK